MEYVRLGTTGLKVSRIALGCMSYGDPTSTGAHTWALDDEAAQPFFRQAVELGVTFWDTANVYQHGTSEELVGRAITRYSRREEKPFVAMQDQYNLLRRQDERELLPMCADMGVGTVLYSPQSKGRLARPWGEQSHRSSGDAVVKAFDSPLDEPVVDAVQRIAEARGTSMAQVALAWVLKHPVVSAPIVGATKPHHLPDSIAALDLHLTDDEIHALEEPYTPHGPSWY